MRPPANLQRHEGYHLYEGIIEADRWFGPLFTNLRLVKTDVPIHFSTELPLVQVQPLHRATYAEEVSNSYGYIAELARMPAEAWSGYEQSIVKPSVDGRPAGGYAASVRRRRKSACPVHVKA